MPWRPLCYHRRSPMAMLLLLLLIVVQPCLASTAWRVSFFGIQKDVDPISALKKRTSFIPRSKPVASFNASSPSDEERIKTGFVGNIASGFMKSLGDVWFGFSYVFKNYLNISTASMSRVIPLNLLLHLVFKRGFDMFPKCCETTRLALISFLTKLTAFSNVVHIFLMLPILLPIPVLIIVWNILDPSILELHVDRPEKKPSITDRLGRIFKPVSSPCPEGTYIFI
jgi:hypothetical protein